MTTTRRGGIKKAPDQKRDRFLSADELRRFGDAMRQCESDGANRTGLAAIRSLMLSGCRRTEILGLQKSWIDFGAKAIRFPDTKTGRQVRPIGDAAFKCVSTHLTGTSNVNENSRWVFPASRGPGHFIGIPKLLARICARANLKNVSCHVFRHTYASVAAEMGYTELVIAGLIGHAVRGVTNRYSHLPDRALAGAADRVAQRIASILDGSLSSESGPPGDPT